MSELGFKAACLGDIADFEMGQAPPGRECNKDGVGTVFVKTGEFGELFPEKKEWTTKPLKFGKDGDVFICVVGATCGKLNLGIDCAIGRSVAAIRPKGGAETRFIYYQLMPWVLKLRASSSGSAQGVISKKQLKEVPVVIAPREQQTRIVAEIEKQFSRLDEAVANLKRVKANLKRYKAAVLKAAVEGKLTEEWRKQHPDVEPADKLLERILVERREKWQGRGKYKEPVAPDTTDLPELPEGWVLVQLQSLVTLLGDGLHGTPNYTPGTKYFFINGNNLNNGKIEIKPSTKTVSYEELQKHKKILNSNTVLVSINGTLGNVAFYNGEEVMLGKSACYFNLCDSVSKGFIKTILDSPYFMNYAITNATGSTIKNLSLKAMNSFPVPLPSIKEQHQIVSEAERRLSIVDGAENQLDADLRRSDRLRQSILKKAFTGGLIS